MRHGTSTGYITHKCRCEECRAYIRRWNKQYRLDLLRGNPRKVDAAPVHAHIQSLLDGGMSMNAIREAGGYASRNSLLTVLRQDTVTPRVARRIMAIRPQHDTRPGAFLDPTGTRRRLQALAVNGWTSRAIAERLGRKEQSTVLDIQSGRAATVRRWTADAVAALYDELWDVPGPSVKARAHAQRNGWLPPLAWDDDTIDDPAAVPQQPDEAPIPSRGRSREHVIEDFLDTLDHHQGDARLAAERLGMTWMALTKALTRANHNGAGITWRNGYKKAAA
jgi:hypothetical protein